MKINLFETLPGDVQKLLVTKYLDPETAYHFALFLKNGFSKKDFMKIQSRYITEKLGFGKDSFRKIIYRKLDTNTNRYPFENPIECPLCHCSIAKKNKGSHQRKCAIIEKCNCCNLFNFNFATRYRYAQRKYFCPFKNIWNCPTCHNFKHKTMDQVIYHFNKHEGSIVFQSPNVLRYRKHTMQWCNQRWFTRVKHEHEQQTLESKSFFSQNFYPIICSTFVTFAVSAVGYAIYNISR